MGHYNTPLRYPGGKAFLTDFFSHTIEANGIEGGVYIEPFAGGAGAALNLLFSEYVRKIKINDLDFHIYSFWKSILLFTEDFIKKINDVNINVDEWKKQKQIYLNYADFSELEVGFSTFFLNRCNRSGILKGGIIGGLEQLGKWKIDARFNKIDLVKRIEKIALYKNRILISNEDAISFLNKIKFSESTLIYLDPPYYAKGECLYLNHYKSSDHKELAECIDNLKNKWILSYDNVRQVKKLYNEKKKTTFSLNYSTHSHTVGKELMIFSDNLILPEDYRTFLT